MFSSFYYVRDSLSFVGDASRLGIIRNRIIKSISAMPTRDASPTELRDDLSFILPLMQGQHFYPIAIGVFYKVKPHVGVFEAYAAHFLVESSRCIIIA